MASVDPASSTKDSKTCEGQYTIVASEALRANRDYNVAVAVHHTKEPVTLKIGITGPSYNEAQTVELLNSDEFQQITFKVPALTSGDYLLTAEGVAGMELKNSKKLFFEEFKPRVKLQTDRRKYKPGDTVNYRIVFLDENQMPSEAPDDLVVRFDDSKRRLIAMVKDIQTRCGVYTGKLQLSELAALGLWTLSVQNCRTDERVQFEVEKYVLPRYIVKMDANQHVSVKDGNLYVVVRAKYAYGNPVNGKVLLKVHRENSTWWSHTLIRNTNLVNGIAKFDIDVKELDNFSQDNFCSLHYKILATIEEDFTGVKLSETGSFQLHANRYKMINIYSDTRHELVFQVTYVDGTLLKDNKSPVKLRLFPGMYNTGHGIQEIEGNSYSEFLTQLNESSFAVFKLPPSILPKPGYYSPHHIAVLQFDGEEQTQDINSFEEPIKCMHDEIMRELWSKERSKDLFRLIVQTPTKNARLKIGEVYQVTLESSRPLKNFVYNIIGRGNVLQTERVVLSEPQEVHSIPLTPTFQMLPNGRIYAYYVDDSGLFRHAKTEFDVEVQLPNPIQITAPVEVKPGADVELEINTAPGSFVGLMAVDQSACLGANNNDVKNDPFSCLGRYNIYPTRQRLIGLVAMTNAEFFYDRMPIYLREESFYSSSSTDEMMTRAATPAAPAALDRPLPKVRRNFAETWLFEDIERTETETFKWVRKIPDTITSWVLSAFSLHPERGLGVINDQLQIKTYQPFFVSVRLPYSVRRGEVINVPALVFNYLPHQLNVEVTLSNEDNEYDFVDLSSATPGDFQKCTKTVKVGANATVGASFLLRPRIVGSILLKFTAVSPLAGDAVLKTLKVVPEGVTQYRNRAFFLNLTDVHEFKGSFELDLPEDLVPDSQHIEVGFSGYLLGPAIKNLERLLRLPSGCGEQAMSKLVPNYLVYDYLRHMKKLTPESEHRIKRNLEQGYQHMLHYRLDDGSYSSFGPSRWHKEDPERKGSTWLTAYVLRSFGQIRHLIKVDENLLESGYEFLLSRQAENGSFTENGDHFYAAQRSALTITANVLLALLEHQKPNQSAIDRAVAYLSARATEKNAEGLLPRAIATYALQRAKSPDAAKHVAALQALAKHEADHTWWTEDNVKFCASQNIEITSYAVLSLLELGQETPASLLYSIRWLVAQRNSFGGFASSQDTVAGLQALIQFAKKFGGEPARWHVSISNHGQRQKTEQLSLTEDDALLLQTVEFPQGTKSLSYEVKGAGAALLQVSYQYNVVAREPKPSFKIQAIVQPRSPPAKLALSVSVEYVEEGNAKASNMAILEVSLPSGYKVDEDSFKDIQKIDRVRLVETKNDDSVLVIYFESLHKGDIKCLLIEAVMRHHVAYLKPVPIVLYDYYDTNRKATEYYEVKSQVRSICEGFDLAGES
ncbi:PREDICTED: CD109 antigen [Drosophila arizonae]|uniref:CD109 antigen n=1 Tax=Drosophila arizonae TaxID=7263 RepID=A0ABM1NQW2_DROAR|nr:PREDICTED: CD109 antigen [Drosophila arizonae]